MERFFFCFERRSPALEGLKVTETRSVQSTFSSLKSHSVKPFLYTTKSPFAGERMCAEKLAEESKEEGKGED